MMNEHDRDPRARLAADACVFHQRGWMYGTAGNLSARQGDDTLWITSSGRPKGALTSADFIRVNLAGEVVERPTPSSKPSAETSIHLALYRLFPKSRAVYHVHTIESNLLCRLHDSASFVLPRLEMLKGLGIWREHPTVRLQVLPNHFDVPRIAAELSVRFRDEPPEVPGFLIRDHGLTVWGDTEQDAFNFLELFDYLFRYALAARNAGLPEI